MRITSWSRHAVPKHFFAPPRAAFFTVLLAAILAEPTAAAPPPAEVFGALPVSTDVVMTPNGQRLAWIDYRFPKPRVVMFDIAARKELRVLALPERLKVRRLLWNDDETLIITFSETRNAWTAAQSSREYFVNIAYDASGGDGRMLPAVKGNNNDARRAAATSLVRWRLSKPHTVIMASNCHSGDGCLLAVDTATGEATVIKSGNQLTDGWAVNRDGVPVAREDWDWKTRAYRVYSLSGDSVREILRRDDNERPLLVGILPDNSALVLLTPNGHGRQVVAAARRLATAATRGGSGGRHHQCLHG